MNAKEGVMRCYLMPRSGWTHLQAHVTATMIFTIHIYSDGGNIS